MSIKNTVDDLARSAGAVPAVDRTQRVLTDGRPVTDDHRDIKPNGQQKGYVILSDEERARGFVRPVRVSYVHVGPPKPDNLRDLTEDERRRYAQYGYVKYEAYDASKEKSAVVGKYWTQEQLDRLGGCGVKTTMGISIAETYARDPTFYGGTFCCGCGAHFPVGKFGEFVWDGTDERVGT
jgi:hypothetical protein